MAGLTLVVALIGAAARGDAQQLPPGAPSLEGGDTSVQTLEARRRAEIDRVMKAGDLARAEELLVAEIQRSQKPAPLLELLASVFMKDRKPLNAAIALKKAETYGPLGPQARYQLALAYIGMRRGEWARPELERLSAAEPANAAYLYWLGRLDYDAGKYASAITRLERVISLDPAYIRAYDNLGLCYEALNEPEKAVAQYREAIRRARLLGEPWPWPFLNLGVLQRKEGSPAEAEALFREALTIDPNFAPALYQLGTVLEDEDKPDDAIAMLQKSTVADPSYAEPHFALSRIYRRQGRTKEADDALAAFERLHAPTREPKP
jgi:tetratricopeptide (TPR) repeat protein